MDDFELVLGMDFLHTSKVVPMPYLGSLLVTSHQLCLLRTHAQAEKGKELKGPLLLAMQLKKGMRRNDPMFLATLSMKDEEVIGDIPEVIGELLGEYADILPKELPKSLPPRRDIDHSIELVAGWTIKLPNHGEIEARGNSGLVALAFQSKGWACLYALRWALDNGCRSIKILTDSALLFMSLKSKGPSNIHLLRTLKEIVKIGSTFLHCIILKVDRMEVNLSHHIVNQCQITLNSFSVPPTFDVF
uniref:RNase H type-1 domain-containing protein n=1 Tax=Chenopodium quinoa TaxID=63459 RepID=A0A803MIN8_CHEQI